MSELHEQYFEGLYDSQMKCVNNAIIKDAKTVILKLILYMNTSDKGINLEKDEAVLEALKWLKNNSL